jgi:hypothetical protein
MGRRTLNSETLAGHWNVIPTSWPTRSGTNDASAAWCPAVHRLEWDVNFQGPDERMDHPGRSEHLREEAERTHDDPVGHPSRCRRPGRQFTDLRLHPCPRRRRQRSRAHVGARRGHSMGSWTAARSGRETCDRPIEGRVASVTGPPGPHSWSGSRVVPTLATAVAPCRTTLPVGPDGTCGSTTRSIGLPHEGE